MLFCGFILANLNRIALSPACFYFVYGVLRSVAEIFRQPDPQLGFIAWNWLTMGQLLSFIMIALGVILLVWAYKGKSNATVS